MRKKSAQKPLFVLKKTQTLQEQELQEGLRSAEKRKPNGPTFKRKVYREAGTPSESVQDAETELEPGLRIRRGKQSRSILVRAAKDKEPRSNSKVSQSLPNPL